MNERIDVAKDEQKLLSALGLCVRARKLIFGVPMICEAMRRGGVGKPLLVLEASDTSENTHKKITDKCKFYQIKQIRLNCDGMCLAQALGKTSALAAVAVNDASMLKMVERCLAGGNYDAQPTENS